MKSVETYYYYHCYLFYLKSRRLSCSLPTIFIFCGLLLVFLFFLHFLQKLNLFTEVRDLLLGRDRCEDILNIIVDVRFFRFLVVYRTLYNYVGDR